MRSGLAAEKRRDLQQVDVGRGELGMRGQMDVGGDRHAEVGADPGEQLAAILDLGAAKRPHGTAVRLVERRLENERHALVAADRVDLFRHPPRECLGLDHAGAENEEQTPASQ